MNCFENVLVSHSSFECPMGLGQGVESQPHGMTGVVSGIVSGKTQW